jgi:hypothetical protein
VSFYSSIGERSEHTGGVGSLSVYILAHSQLSLNGIVPEFSEDEMAAQRWRLRMVSSAEVLLSRCSRKASVNGIVSTIGAIDLVTQASQIFFSIAISSIPSDESGVGRAKP